MKREIMSNWKAIPNYEDLYEVSSDGQVRSLGRVVGCISKWGTEAELNCKPVLMKPYTHDNGYKTVILFDKASNRKSRTIHSLVAQAFIGPRLKNLVVRHLDGNSFNNDISNLDYGTHKDNMQDAVRHGTAPIGEKNPAAKLSETTVLDIRNRCALGVTTKEMVVEFKMTKEAINNITAGRSWKHIGGPIRAAGTA
jgi:hypothetical protein